MLVAYFISCLKWVSIKMVSLNVIILIILVLMTKRSITLAPIRRIRQIAFENIMQ